MSPRPPHAEPLDPRRLFATDLLVNLFRTTYLAGPSVPVTATVAIVNREEAADTSRPIPYRVVIASDEALTRDVIVIASGTVDPIAPGDYAEVDVRYDLPEALYGKERMLGVTIDADDDAYDNVASNYFAIASVLSSYTIVGTDGDDEIRIDNSYLHADDFGPLAVYGAPGAGESGVQFADLPAAGQRLTIDLKAGDDKLECYIDNADVVGGDGDDAILTLDGGNAVDGGAGNDSIESRDGDDTILGGAGDDTISSGSGHDVIDTGEGDDFVTASFGDDTVDGGAGDDVIDAGSGDDSVRAGAGDDYVRGRDGADAIDGGAGRDTLHGDAGDDRVAGGSGGDSLNGGAGDDTLLGQGGNDRLYGAAGLDHLIGGAGDDRLAARDEAIDVLSGNAGEDEAWADASDLLAGIERRAG